MAPDPWSVPSFIPDISQTARIAPSARPATMSIKPSRRPDEGIERGSPPLGIGVDTASLRQGHAARSLHSAVPQRVRLVDEGEHDVAAAGKVAVDEG
jgi:hypothetical protein